MYYIPLSIYKIQIVNNLDYHNKINKIRLLGNPDKKNDKFRMLI